MPWHSNRTWRVTPMTAEDAVEWMHNSYVACGGFRIVRDDDAPELLVLNDSTGPDGAQEWAVIEVRKTYDTEVVGFQRESLTCSWMEPASILDWLDRLARDPDAGGMKKAITVRIDPNPNHRCAHCA